MPFLFCDTMMLYLLFQGYALHRIKEGKKDRHSALQIQIGHNTGLVVGSSSECSVFEHVESIFLGHRVMFDKEIIINKTKSNVYKMH